MKSPFTSCLPVAESFPKNLAGVARLYRVSLVALALVLSAHAGRAAGLPPSDRVVAALLRQLPKEVGGEDSASTKKVADFYARAGFAPVWTRTEGVTPEAQAGVTLLVSAARYGLKPAEYQATELVALFDSLSISDDQAPARRVRAEHQLSAALLRFTQHLHEGRITSSDLRPTASTIAAAFDGVAHLQYALHSGRFAEALLEAQPASRSYVRLLRAWQRLLDTDSAAAKRVAQPVAINLERLRWEPGADSLYLAVNIPSYTLQVVRGAKVAASHRVIVGKAITPTPELYSRVTFMQAAPEWRVPQSIAANEMLPKLRRDPGFLDDRGFELYNAAGKRVNPYRVDWNAVTPEAFPYQIRQAPSEDNALGEVVFRFANPYSVYMHDTPAKKAFQANARALSHGCIRVEKPVALARFLLERDGKNAASRVNDLQNSIDSGRTKAIGLQAPVTLLVRYLTCEADGDQLRQLPDIYGRDKALAHAWNDVMPTTLTPLMPMLAQR
ncbi:L,D-transpeptidase family protein [Hymenobacter arizonensis]|uniref:L,D-transpeptidase catalytic domain n=1 Tax=Hymenobacter arizonensis TaxID=1227077 RepID=A0A1I6AH04_HYMAR|nr:L,D-transpeptidase family protein [Hymenobacter arizonensis]SFQ67883.1 L,D-transpeptidase catalytic domain [Hymenobacter arizonensis]